MKKNLFFIACCLLLAGNCFAQSGTWTWMNGSNSYGSPGTWGTQGVPDTLNSPPAVYSAFLFTDKTGNFWLFGGAQYNLGNKFYGAFWKYNPDANTWTWMNGTSLTDQPAVYGVIGIPSPTNYPGSRGFAGLSWVDTSGNFWLYGGGSLYGDIADFWKYDLTTNEWTCFGSYSSFPVYGTKGVGTASTNPGIRTETCAAWTGDDGNLWLYGGQGAGGSYADMWKYDLSSGYWIWMQGSDSIALPGVSPVYGNGSFNSMNTPGTRNTYNHWKDAAGTFWIYGGGNPYFKIFADLWQFDPATLQWAWKGGDTTAFYAGSFQMQCDTSQINFPRSVTENRASWMDQAGNLWRMGGATNSVYAMTNDLWLYNRAADKWVWVSGSSGTNQAGMYGTKGVPNPANHPGARMGALNWVDYNCNLWYFGGRNQAPHDFNDMWRYIPDTACTHFDYCTVNSGSVAFSSTDTDICQKFCIDFFDLSANNPTSWLWIFDGGTPSTSVDPNPTNICYNNPGTYDVTLITTNANGSDTFTLSNYITVFSTPPLPTITVNGNILTSSYASSYQWQFNSADIPGATNQTYTATQSGFYTVVITDENGCVSSITVFVEVTGIDEAENEYAISITPNPSNGKFTVAWSAALASSEISFEVINTLGQRVFYLEGISSSDGKQEIDLSATVAGVYFLRIQSENIFLKKKIIISK